VEHIAEKPPPPWGIVSGGVFQIGGEPSTWLPPRGLVEQKTDRRKEMDQNMI